MIAIVGSGPAGLMAADVISAAGQPVVIFEKRKSIGRKLLVAGSSGLNITNNLPVAEFVRHYTGAREFWVRVIGQFTPADWVGFIEQLGIGTFVGTSGRYFVEDMKASSFLQAWRTRLVDRGVEFRFDRELTGFSSVDGRVELEFAGGHREVAQAACLCLGGASWEPSETPLRWPQIFRDRGLGFADFRPSNVGYGVRWSDALLKEAEGKPLKKVELTTAKGKRIGEMVLTRYGLEGGPIYFVGQRGPATLDLKPDLTAKQIVERLSKSRENLSAIRRVDKLLGLCEASFALLFHTTPAEIRNSPDLGKIASRIKALPLELGDPQPLTEAISSAGGLHLEELSDQLELRKFPGVFAAGEMLDWDAPTGGFLIQACVAQGHLAARGILARAAQ